MKPAPVRAEQSGLPEDVYLIGCGPASLDPAQRGKHPVPAGASTKTVGNKAFNLLRMAAMGLTVPQGFVIGTRYCPTEAPAAAAGAGPAAAGSADAATRATAPVIAPVVHWKPALERLEQATGLTLGSPARPLLLSVRSGAPVSMPGMMETLLNIGLCDATLPGLIRLTGNPRLAWDAYRRLVATFGEVVGGLPAELFEGPEAKDGRDERSLDFAELRDITRRHLETYANETGHSFPQNPRDQLNAAIKAVFISWNAAKAREYRRINHIADDIGTAVTVQRMVFGNSGGKSGAGVGFTRDPSSGENRLWVDFLFNAQGEDVVSGRRNAHGHEQLAEVIPAAWRTLGSAVKAMEREFGDMQDFEFTVENGTLYLLQTRSGKRTPQAAAHIALDLLDAGIITADEARRRTEKLDRNALACTRIKLKAAGKAGAKGGAKEGSKTAAAPVLLATAATASIGVASGEVALDEARARTRKAAGASVILVRQDAETSDIAAIEASAGLLSQRGARTSHAAVVARQLGKVCLVGCSDMQIDMGARCIRFGEQVFGEGDPITLDGNEGRIYAGEVSVVREVPAELLHRLEALRKGA